ncbi:hypothetical protein BAE44_0021370 [Dichanthelium oligosanthes]|uniref:Uncharacterized protein n=1 Tax=Dichanthelium oligosanthes TaxID=888268 RepID=A0A1E5UXQ5_9POAL|nr:hypothetical protein BAE44_0021370 [Dichanthelium oligosanthes]
MAKFLHGRSRFLKAMEFHCKRDSDTQALPKATERRMVLIVLVLFGRAMIGVSQLPCSLKAQKNVDLVFGTILYKRKQCYQLLYGLSLTNLAMRVKS